MVPYSRRSDVVNRSPGGAGVDSRRPTRRRSSQRLLRRRRRRRQLVVVHTTPCLRLAVRENGITIGFVGRNTTTVALLDETETQQSVTTTKCCCNGDDDSNKNASDGVYSAPLTVGQTPCWRWRDCDVCLSAWLATVISRSMQARTIAASADTPPDSRNYVLPCMLLQLTAVRHQRRITLTPAVGAERSRPPGHRRPSVWPHHTSVTAAALAACPSVRCVQARVARASVACWSGCRVRRRRLSPSVGRGSSPTAVQLQWHEEAARVANT